MLGLEGSAELVAHARARLGDAADIRQHDLNTPLDDVDDDSFDGVLCALVLHHLSDRARFLDEVFRVTRPGGWLVLSTTHPAADWRHFKDSYFSDKWVQLAMRDGKHSIQFQRMSLETVVEEVLSARFILERLVEPRPVEALRDVDPAAYDKLTRAPPSSRCASAAPDVLINPLSPVSARSGLVPSPTRPYPRRASVPKPTRVRAVVPQSVRRPAASHGAGRASRDVWCAPDPTGPLTAPC